MTVKVGICGFTKDEFAVLGYLLYPYKVKLTPEADDSDFIICRGSLDSDRPQIRVSVGPTPGEDLEPKAHGNGIVHLPSDFIRACSERFEAIMKPRVASIYKLATLHFPYHVVPSRLRNAFLRIHAIDYNLAHHLGTEMTRKLLIEASEALGFRLEKKNTPSLVITHDIETGKGLMRALSFKGIEDELGIQSTWFLPSHEYAIPRFLARELGEGSTIGSHDMRHDGRLIYVQTYEGLVDRLSNSRLKLERIFDREITRFRSPLLQFSRRIAVALVKSGYRFDFSVPCWEPVHEVTMGGFGAECVREFDIEGIVEVPLTLFQDHQLLNVLGLNTREAVGVWLQQAKLIHSLGGNIVLLIHPEYGFSRDLKLYRGLLVSLSEAQAA